ncbi:hypothetical protein PENTCL1PPCAC_1781, partial [Pristionchus entomophagus]
SHNCCDSRTCKLREHAACASGACCDLSTCSFAASTRMCRDAKTSCDLPEFCDGLSIECPDDVHRTN